MSYVVDCSTFDRNSHFQILCCFPDDVFGIMVEESWRHNAILFDTMACGEEVCSNCCHLILVELDEFYDVLKETHSLHVCPQLVVVHAVKCLAVVYDMYRVMLHSLSFSVISLMLPCAALFH